MTVWVTSANDQEDWCVRLLGPVIGLYPVSLIEGRLVRRVKVVDLGLKEAYLVIDRLTENS